MANIVTIIQRLDNQIASSTKLILEYDSELKTKKDAAFECQLETYNLENTKTKIMNAIEDRNERISQFKMQIDLNN